MKPINEPAVFLGVRGKALKTMHIGQTKEGKY
jgi:hypothetical protein